MSTCRIAAVLLIIFTVGFVSGTAHANSEYKENQLKNGVREMFEARALAIITGADPAPVLAAYETSETLGLWAQIHERERLDYVQQWAKKRGVHFTEAKSSLSIPWYRMEGNYAELLVNETLQLGYVYPGSPTVNRFGTGSRHWLKLVCRGSKWLILQDFYTDGLGDNFQVPNPTPADGAAVVGQPGKRPAAKNSTPVVFDREGAVRYADKYAGLAWGAGNDNSYNRNYRDFNDRGGDCANFVSQCLGDQDGGKMVMDDLWYYDRQENAGSQSWVRAESFGDWILYSGRGRRLARGTFSELNQPTSKFPGGAVRELAPGDVIGYGETGYSRHLAIVVGTDSQGYPLVNAHNVDRYHCPWDMGYDKTTFFHLYQVND
ncbi:putative amidase domain protein [Pelotomaculum schinkii]|uniref:Putative amidase domain protein n=1 Tax=Pelotomaculum schinkii TaxID=78350 RepID=A0A4Y7R9W9_9FIRM|nr:amidase domain-containing protein [Pelotomaculum schinkii]TEB05744.1 putative amidase domain protein [Pelotomaculum schinkii]